MNISEKNEFVNMEPERINEKIFLNLVRIAQVYRKALTSSNDYFDLSPNELGLLMIMYMDPAINTANQIVKVLGTTKGLASRNIDNLTQKGFIVTNQDDKDRRIVRLTLCSKAIEICDEIRRNTAQLFEKALEGVDMADLISAYETLQKIAANIR
ncbi:MAG: MarR family transcriptional regulator [Oscillospiraceae bacterium]|nr:MarR family transcriptional regulator [Oscillospiraceae bacterium]